MPCSDYGAQVCKVNASFIATLTNASTSQNCGFHMWYPFESVSDIDPDEYANVEREHGDDVQDDDTNAVSTASKRSRTGGLSTSTGTSGVDVLCQL